MTCLPLVRKRLIKLNEHIQVIKARKVLLMVYKEHYQGRDRRRNRWEGHIGDYGPKIEIDLSQGDRERGIK